MANNAEMKGFTRGWFAAVAHLLRGHGRSAEAEYIFKLGGDPVAADPEDKTVFIEHGLMKDPYEADASALRESANSLRDVAPPRPSYADELDENPAS